MTRFMTRNGLLAAIALALAACASPANREAMMPVLSVSKQHPYGVEVKTAGGAETGLMDTSNISNEDLKASIEAAIARSGLFKAVIKDAEGADYELSVTIITLSKPMFGGTFTVDLEAAWSLIRTADRSVAMRKSFRTTGVANMGEAFAGATRLRMAVERAASSNIDQGLKAIAELKL